MERKLLWAIIAFLFVMNVILFTECRKYETYYFAAEELLDELDAKYDWVDAFDPEDYYEIRYKIEDNK